MDSPKRKILIVDDSPELAQFVSKLLEAHYMTSITSDGQTAIQKVFSESPELVLLDLKLPDIPGTEVLKKIKEINEETAVIVMTAYGGEQLAVGLMKAGAVDYLSKPFDEESLIGAVRNALKIRDAQIEDKRKEIYLSLERFFPFLAHEVRNPLHAIDGAMAIIQRRSRFEGQAPRSIHQGRQRRSPAPQSVRPGMSRLCPASRQKSSGRMKAYRGLVRLDCIEERRVTREGTATHVDFVQVWPAAPALAAHRIERVRDARGRWVGPPKTERPRDAKGRYLSS